MAYNFNGDKGSIPIVQNGRVCIKGANGIWETIGYFSAAQIQLQTQVQSLYSSIKGVRSMVDDFVSERSVSINITTQSAQQNNLVIATYSTANRLAASGAVEETITVNYKAGGPNRFANRFIISHSKVTDLAGLVTYVEGKNYVMEQSTIYVLSPFDQELAGAEEIMRSGQCKITGKFMATTVLNGFTVDKVEREFLFTGMNISKGKKRPIELYVPRLSFQPGSMDLLSDAGYGSMSWVGNVLPDENIQGIDESGNDLSQYFEYRLPDETPEYEDTP